MATPLPALVLVDQGAEGSRQTRTLSRGEPATMMRFGYEGTRVVYLAHK